MSFSAVRAAAGAYRPGRTLYLSLFLLAIPFASGATYYVAVNGNDANPGTQAAPVQTLQRAVNLAVAGDTVIVGDGTYGHVNAVTGGDGSSGEASPVWLYNSGTSSAWITIKAQNKGAAILDCEMLCDSYINLYNASYVVIQDLVITRGYKEAIHSNDTAHHITLKGNVFAYIANRATTTPYGLSGMYTNPNCHDFVIDGNAFHDIGRTSGSSSLDHGLYLHGSNYTVTNNLFYKIPAGWAIQMADGLSNILVANNTFAFPNSSLDGQIMLWNTQNNLTIRNNIFYNPQNVGITRYASTVNGCAIDHNLVYGASGLISDASGCSLGTNPVGSNPLFLNASTAPYDFHAQSGGAGVDTGMNLSAVPTDFDGSSRPQGSSTDIGAYEYVPVIVSPPPVISNVFTSGVLTTSATVNWSTDQASTSFVQYGILSSAENIAQDTNMVTQHSIPIAGLVPATLYHFRVGSTNASGVTSYSSDSTLITASIATSFSLSPATSGITVVQGQASSDSVTATLIAGSEVSVSFSTGQLPAGVSAAFSTPTCIATCTTILNVSASASAVAGTYSIVVTGTGSGVSSSTSITLAVSAPPPPPGASLMSRWDFGELAGSTTADLSGNGNTGLLNNVSWASNVCSACVWLSGSSSYVSVNESPSLESTNQISVSMWVNPSNKNSNVDPRLLSKLYSWEVKLNGSNRYPQFSAGGMYAMLNYPLAANRWQHIVFTFANGVVRGYVNGSAVSAAQYTFANGVSLPLQMYGLYMGTDPSRTASFKGYLDDVRIYNGVLSDSDVATLYSSTRH